MASESTTRVEHEKAVPLYAEKISIAKRKLATRRVQVSVVTRQREKWIRAMLTDEKVSVERVPIGKALAHKPEVQQVGDTLIIPVVQEVLTIERRFILKEEIRVRRIRSSHTHQERVSVRKQEVVMKKETGDAGLRKLP